MKSASFVLLYSPWALIIVDRLAALELAVDVTAGTLFDSAMRYVARSLPGFYCFLFRLYFCLGLSLPRMTVGR